MEGGMKANKVINKTSIKIIILVIVCVLFGAWLNNCSKGFTEDKFEVLSTTDMGGLIWDQGLQTGENQPNNLLAASTAIKQSRANYGNRTITWDSGNLWQDTLLESLGLAEVNSDKIKDIHSCSIVADEIKYDGFNLGNHENNFDYDLMEDNYNYIKDSSTYVCANIYDSATNERIFQPYLTKTFKINGGFLKVGIIGLENPDIGLWDASIKYPNIIAHSPENPNGDLAYEIKKVQKEMNDVGEDCDFVIVSMYDGMFYDDDDIHTMNDKAYKTLHERNDKPLAYGSNTEAQAYRTITNTTGIDMFILGCDHKSFYSNMTFKNFDESKDVLVVNAAAESVTKSIFKANYDKGKDSFNIELVSSENMPLRNFSSDQVLKNRIYPYIEDVLSKFKEKPGQIIGTWHNGYDEKDYYTTQTDYADLINRAQMWTGYRISNTTQKTVEDINLKMRRFNGDNTNLQFRSNLIQPDMSITTIPGKKAEKEIQNGKFDFQNATKVYPDDYYVCGVALTGAEIKETLEYNAEHKYEVAVDEDGNKRVELIGDSNTLTIPYGLNFHYQMDRPVGNKVIIDSFANGKAFDPNEIYVVMVNNYIINSSETKVYETISWNRVIYDQELNQSGTYIRNLIDFYVNTKTQDHGGLYPSADADRDGEYVSKWYINF